MDGSEKITFFPSGVKYKVVGQIGQKDTEFYSEMCGLEVSVFVNDDRDDTEAYLHVRWCDPLGEEEDLDKYYLVGKKGLVEVEDLHRA